MAVGERSWLAVTCTHGRRKSQRCLVLLTLRQEPLHHELLCQILLCHVLLLHELLDHVRWQLHWLLGRIR